MAEDLRLLLDLEALSRMRPESLLKDCLNILVRHGLCENFWGGQSWQNPVWLIFYGRAKCAREADRGNSK